jgi:hypothetical protein
MEGLDMKRDGAVANNSSLEIATAADRNFWHLAK